ncbi:LAFA_0G22078g1_1 [Lachancea sp. 'fantastica']|nr:LAFA_0G22078g1_1 [Lachancea sp. 'fantastica']
MSANSLRQWLKVARKQVKQIRQTLDEELQNVLERNIPRPQKALVRVPIPVKPSTTFGKGSRFLHTITRGTAQDARAGQKAFAGSAPRFSSYGKKGVFANFNGSYRAPRGAPRGLFTNWNMSTMRFAPGRSYSTSAIKITHDAAQNLSISLRCFFNLWEGFSPLDTQHNTGKLALRESGAGTKPLGNQAISMIRAMEVCRMIQDHRQELVFDDENETESLGCVVEFQLPRLDVSKMPTFVFASDEALDNWRHELMTCNTRMREIEESVRTIHKNYGALPLEFGESYVRVRFPNLTMNEAEVLMRDLGLTLGLVLPEQQANPKHSSRRQEPWPDAFENDLGPRSCRSTSDFGSVLSSSSTSETHFSEFSVLSSQA